MNEQKQQKLRAWILKQDYFSLNGKFDGMTAWELAGIILKVLEYEHNEKDNSVE